MERQYCIWWATDHSAPQRSSSTYESSLRRKNCPQWRTNSRLMDKLKDLTVQSWHMYVIILLNTQRIPTSTPSWSLTGTRIKPTFIGWQGELYSSWCYHGYPNHWLLSRVHFTFPMRRQWSLLLRWKQWLQSLLRDTKRYLHKMPREYQKNFNSQLRLTKEHIKPWLAVFVRK